MSNKYILNKQINSMEKLRLTKFSSLLLFIAVMSMAVVVSSCSDDSPPPVVVDTSVLEASIAEAENIIATTNEGTEVGEYEAGSQATLQTAIDLAQAVVADATSTQTEVDNADVGLQAAIAVYETKVIAAIDPATLVGYWQFDEGTGTTAGDASGNSLDGTFMTGRAAWGAGDPAWATDRNGTANEAIAFTDGAWIEVPYNTAINPAQMTVSIWVNAAEINGNNRFLGLHSWLGFKFQLQDGNKSFFTAAMSPEHTGDIFDKDTDPPLEINTWYHLVVATGGGEMVFYINGTETARWTDTPGEFTSVTDHNLAIGVGSSKYADTDANYGDDTHPDYHIIPEAWGGYFRGSLDELRMYNTVLTGPQVRSIYNDEKPE